MADLAIDDIRAIKAGVRPIAETVFGELPVVASEWAAKTPMWLVRFRHCIAEYVARLNEPGPVDPRTLAERVALRMAFVAARAEPDPDSLLPPDVADVLPLLPGDYAWTRAEQAIGASEILAPLYGEDPARPAAGVRHPESWFDAA
jgi:hypothetical protein